MVIQPNLPTVAPQFTKISPTKSPIQPANDYPNGAGSVNTTEPPELNDPDEVNLIMDLAKKNIMGQSNLALAAHGNLSPETVLSLVQP